MNDDRLLSEVRAWLQADAVAPPDAEQAGREIRMRLPQTRRPQGHWWSLRDLGGKRSAAPATPSIAYRPRPVEATTGLARIVTRRTHPMFTPIRILAIGVLAAVVGGAVVITKPFDQPDEVVPAAESAAQVAGPVGFTGTGSDGACEVPATTEVDGPVAHTRGASCGPTYSFSDSRLEGTVTWSSNDDEYTDGSGLVIQSVAMSIENDQGAWRMIPILSAKWPDPDLGAIEYDATEHFFLVGEGAYDGLIAVVDGFRTDALHGYIIDGELPPAPENAHADQPADALGDGR
jgi:hypothetical protein